MHLTFVKLKLSGVEMGHENVNDLMGQKTSKSQIT